MIHHWSHRPSHWQTNKPCRDSRSVSPWTLTLFRFKRPHTKDTACFRGAELRPFVVEFPVALQPFYHLPCFPMSKDTNPPATTAEIEAMRDSIGRHQITMDRWAKQQLEAHEKSSEGIRESIQRFEKRFDEKLDRSLDEMKRHLGVLMEEIRHDLVGAGRDEVSSLVDSKIDHEVRLLRLERSVGIVA